MAVKIINNARFCNLIDTYDNWMELNPSLREGEFAIVRNKPEDEGTCTIGVIGNGNSFADLMRSDNNIIYFGRGAQYILPPAGTSLGGVKKANDVKTTGIDIKGGVITSDLISGWSATEKCYEINKLIVGKLICDDYTQKPSFEGNYITLRNAENGEVNFLQDGEFSGIEIKNVCQDENGPHNGFFGIDNMEQFYVSRKGIFYPIYSCVSPLFENTVGYYSYNIEDQGFSISKPKPLNFKNEYWAKGEPETPEYEASKIRSYDGGATSELTVDLTPPTMIFNGQEVKYNLEEHSFNFEFDEGGLSTDTIKKLEDIDPMKENISDCQDDIADIQKNKLDNTDIKDGNKITITIESTTGNVVISHSETTREDVISTNPEIITPGLEYSFITGIVTDDQGHITKVITSKYKWN